MDEFCLYNIFSVHTEEETETSHDDQFQFYRWITYAHLVVFVLQEVHVTLWMMLSGEIRGTVKGFSKENLPSGEHEVENYLKK